MKRAWYVETDGWVGLYIDHELVAQGSSIPLTSLLPDESYEFSVRDYEESDQNYVDNCGDLPETLDGLWDNEHMWKVDHDNL